MNGPTDLETNAELDRTTEEVEWDTDVKVRFIYTPDDALERSLNFGIWYDEQMIGGIDPKDSRGELTSEQVTLFQEIFDEYE